MNVSYIKRNFLEQLESNIEKNRIAGFYDANNPWLDEFFGGSHWRNDSPIKISAYPVLTGTVKGDIDSAKAIHKILGDKLTFSQAADARLWTYLCHDVYWKYMKERWGSDSIKDRYFVNGNSSRALSRNGIARLWWFAHLTYIPDRQHNPYELTEILLSNQDIQHNLLERAFGRNTAILHILLDFIHLNPDKFQGEGGMKAGTKRLGKLMNRWGGVRLLDCLVRKEILDYLNVNF